MKRKSKYEAPTSKIVPFRFGTKLTADRPNKTKVNAVNSNVITTILKSRKTINPQISQQPISSFHSNDELFPPIDDVNINNNQSEIISPNESGQLLQSLPTSVSTSGTRGRRALFTGSYKVKKHFYKLFYFALSYFFFKKHRSAI